MIGKLFSTSKTHILQRIRKPSVAPPDCALLIGIPSDRLSFLRKLDGPRDGNFAESFRANSNELAWTGYRRFAERLSSVADEAEALGVRVFRTMALEDLAVAAVQRQVTIVSHSRDPRFRPADLADQSRIRAALCPSYESASQHDDGKELAQCLNAKYFPVRSGNQDLGTAIRFQLQLATIRRQFDEHLPGAFRGGAGVEFAEGFEPFDTIASQFPPMFNGVIDLIVCNSLVLAELIRNRCARSLAIATSDLTFPETRLPLYIATIRLLARSPRPYDDAVQELNVILRSKFQ